MITVASDGASVFPFHIPRFPVCDDQEIFKVHFYCCLHGDQSVFMCVVKFWHTFCTR